MEREGHLEEHEWVFGQERPDTPFRPLRAGRDIDDFPSQKRKKGSYIQTMTRRFGLNLQNYILNAT